MITSIEISDSNTCPRQPARRLLPNLMYDFCKKVSTMSIKNLPIRKKNHNHITDHFKVELFDYVPQYRNCLIAGKPAKFSYPILF